MFSTDVNFERFWSLHPALFYGLAALVGCFACFQPSWLLVLPLFFFCPFNNLKRISCTKKYAMQCMLALSLGLFFYCYGTVNYKLPQLPSQGVFGVAHIQIHSLSTASTHYGKQWVYKGTLKSFLPHKAEESEFKGYEIPFKLTLPFRSDIQRPLAHCDYTVNGCLKPTPTGQYLLYVKKEDPWFPIQNSWSLAEWRFQAKKQMENYIRSHIPDLLSATFLTGIATGVFDDRHMQFEFSRFGLQHILAISGFHFAIVTAIIAFFLRLVISTQNTLLVLLFFLSFYFMILGPTPSVIRAWLTITVGLVGLLLKQNTNGLNSLGFALLLILIYDPHMCCHIGFQLSFLATVAILLLFNGIDLFLQNFFTKRPLSRAIALTPLSQHGYLILSYFRQGIALILAVNITTIPLVLYSFHKFSLIGVLYNLFFPFLVSLSMILLLVSTLTSLIFTPIGDFFHSLNSQYTGFMLNYLYNMPTNIDTHITVESLPGYVVIILLCLTFYFGIWIQHQVEKRRLELDNFSYI